MPAKRYPGATFIQSPETEGQLRDATLGIVMHWTAGHEPGDVAVLSKADPRSVNVQFYTPRDGSPPVYQFTETDERANHGFHMANHFMIGIETEGSGEAWTDAQFANTAKLVAWLCNLYDIPVIHCDPSGHTISTFRGICGHRDLSVGGERVDGNNHTDTVPDGIGWERFLDAVSGRGEDDAFYFEAMPYDEGGVGPKVLGAADGYAQESIRDAALMLVAKANPELVITKLRADDGRFYILGWGNLAGRDWYRSGNFADDSKRDVEIGKRRINLPPGSTALRAFRGKQHSQYPWAT
jgi:hypothetical protein